MYIFVFAVVRCQPPPSGHPPRGGGAVPAPPPHALLGVASSGAPLLRPAPPAPHKGAADGHTEEETAHGDYAWVSDLVEVQIVSLLYN